MPDRLSQDLASLRIDRTGRQTAVAPSSGSGVWRYIGGVAIVATITAAGIFVGPRLVTASARAEVDTTQVSLVSPSQGTADMSGGGYVVPQITVKVSSRVTAKIERVSVQEGAVVHVGDELFRLDAASRTSNVQTWEAKVASARAKVMTARASADEVRQQLVRQKQLAASGAVAPATVEDLAARAHVLNAQVAAADAELKATFAEKATMEVDLKELTIRSTIDGRAVTRPATIGDLAAPDKVLVDLVDFNSLLVEVDIAEGRIEQVRPGTAAEIVLDAYPSKRLRGEVVAVSPKINRAKATGTVKVKFLDDVQLALPEMAARVSFFRQPLDSAELAAAPKKVIPSSAVVERGGQKVAFTIVGDRVHQVPLKLGPSIGGAFEVLDGPVAGTRVVASPSDRLTDGQTVKVK